MEYILFGLFLIFSFIFFMIREKRSLFYGILFISYISFIFLFLFYVSFNYNFQMFTFILLIVVILIIFFLALMPLVSIVILLYNGYLVIKKEGFSLSHSLSFLSGIGLILYIFICPLYFNNSNKILNNIYMIISSFVFYLIVVFIVYFISSLINLIHFNFKNLDYIIVLGCGLNKDKVTPLLASRIDKGISILNKQNENCKIIFSGGKGDDELVAEGIAMYKYAIEKGVLKNRCIIEDKSMNTYENIKFSYDLIFDKSSKICIVTNNFHIFRALIIARNQKIKCIGAGSNTKLYYSINAFIREFIGYLYISKSIHIFMFLLIVIIGVFGLIINQYNF